MTNNGEAWKAVYIKVKNILKKCGVSLDISDSLQEALYGCTEKNGEHIYVLPFELFPELSSAYTKLLSSPNAQLAKDSVFFTFRSSELAEDESAGFQRDQRTDKLMKKIERLLSVTEERGATENEALIASKKAQELLKEYENELTDSLKRDTARQNIVDVACETDKGNSWKYKLAIVLADSYACKMYSESASVIHFRGTAESALTARRMFLFLYKTAVKLGRQEDYSDKKRCSAYGLKHKSIFNSFCVGFVQGVKDKLLANACMLALVVPDFVEKDWNDFINSESLTSSPKKCGSELDTDAFCKGYTEGEKAIDSRYLETTENKLMQKNIKK